MLAIRTLWPPPPDSSQVGKTTKMGTGPIIQSLADLHEPAWWTGVRVAAMAPKEFNVRLLKGDGTPVFDHAADTCTWVQNANTWIQFPWAIPAAMGKALDIKLEITVTDGSAPFMDVAVCFHELPLMSTKDRYFFADAEGRLLQVWNGKIQKDGTPDRGPPPIWRTIYRIIPPTRLLDEYPDSVLCVHEWNEIVNKK